MTRAPAGRAGIGTRLLPEHASRGRGRAHRLFHPLVGADLRTLCTVLYRGGGVSPRRVHAAAIALCTAALRSPFTAAEAAVLAVRLRREPGFGAPGHEASRGASLPAPVFVVGHWRSGTTHLANVLSRSPRFGILPPIAVGLPWEALGLARLVAPFVGQFFPRNRLIDEVALAPDLPQEDELALANMTPLSYYHGVYFPRTLDESFDRGLFFDGCTAAEIRAWAEAVRLYVAKMTLHQGRRPLLIRNPVYSTRIPLLRTLWPDAKFIHIHRNPYVVHASSRRMFATLLRELALQDVPSADVDALVLRVYPRLMARLVEDTAALPPGGFAEVGYETFRREPMRELERIYGELDLPGFAQAREGFAEYLASVSGYRPAAHRWDAADLDRVAGAWGPFIERWGYGAPQAA